MAKRKKILPLKKAGKSKSGKKKGGAKKQVVKKGIGRGKKSKEPLKKKASKKQQVKKKGGFSKSNFNLIKSLLWRNHREDFVSYHDENFIRIVREIFNDCKASGVTCTEDVILKKYADFKQDEKRPKPFILKKFLEPSLYYEIKDVPFTTMAPYLYIVSPMIIDYPHEFRVTEYYKKRVDNGKTEIDINGYRKYFSDWVDWCNHAMREQSGNWDVDSDEVSICFKFDEAVYSEQKKRWEANVYICTPNGRIYSFGYKPKDREEKYEGEYRDVPKPLEEPPTEIAEKRKKKRVTREQKKRDVLDSWDKVLGELKSNKEKQRQEKLAKEWDEMLQHQKQIEKWIRKYKRQKNKRMIKKYQTELDKIIAKLNRWAKKNKFGK